MGMPGRLGFCAEVPLAAASVEKDCSTMEAR